MYTINDILIATKIAEKIEKIAGIEPTEEFWNKFAEKQIKKMQHFASVRDTGESIQGTKLK